MFPACLWTPWLLTQVPSLLQKVDDAVTCPDSVPRWLGQHSALRPEPVFGLRPLSTSPCPGCDLGALLSAVPPADSGCPPPSSLSLQSLLPTPPLSGCCTVPHLQPASEGVTESHVAVTCAPLRPSQPLHCRESLGDSMRLSPRAGPSEALRHRRLRGTQLLLSSVLNLTWSCCFTVFEFLRTILWAKEFQGFSCLLLRVFECRLEQIQVLVIISTFKVLKPGNIQRALNSLVISS